VKYKLNDFYTFFGNSPTDQTRRQIFTLDSSNDAVSRKGVPFRGSVDIAPPVLGVKSPPQKKKIWGRK